MTEKPEHNQIENDSSLMDTQRLLSMEPPAEGAFDLEEILAEFGPGRFESGPESPPPDEPEVPPPEEEPVFFEEPPQPPEEPAPPEPQEPAAADNEEADEEAVFRTGAEETSPLVEEEPPAEAEEEAPEDPAISMEDIVANTVDAVKGEQEEKQERLRKRLEKARKKLMRRSEKRKEPAARHPLPEVEEEPLPSEEAVRHKRRHRECRKSLLLSSPVLVMLWMPWILAQCGVVVPFFSESADNAALCVLLPQAVISVLCWPVFRAALGGLRHGAWSLCATALLSTIITLFDEMTLLLLPERTDAAPLGGLAATLTIFALWGLTSWHRGMAETFRTAAMGEPSQVADRCGGAIAKGAGGRRGFCTRVNMEDTASQWQRLLLPVLAAASLVFAVLSSVGQERGQDMLWCWSVILSAASPLVFPLAFQVPYGRMALRLARSGAAMAGHYGAAVLASSRRLVVTDTDLFPQGAASLGGLKLYGEERGRAVSYAATLAVQGGGLLGRIFDGVCQNERISLQSLEHFHIHDDNGFSGMIHGETVLVGPPAFMRHMAVRLPPNMPSKASVCLAVDGNLVAVFAIKYNAADTVDYAMRLLRRNGLQITLASRDGGVTPKLLKSRFGSDCGAVVPELGERLNLSDPEREAEGPNGLLYRGGLLPFASLAAGSRRLCQTVLVGNLLSIAGSISGVLLGFYLTFTGSYNVLTPLLLLTFLILWVVPMLPLVWSVDKL